MATRKSAASTKDTTGQRRSRGTATRRPHKPETPGATPGTASADIASAAATSPAKTAARQTRSVPLPDSTKLNARQRAFVVEYLRDKNATQAAIRAGYSEATARFIGSENLTKPNIASEIARLEAEQLAAVQKETGISLERTLREIAKAAFHDPRRFFADSGHLRPISELDDDVASALAGFDVVEERERNEKGRFEVVGYTKKIRIADRAKYLDMLMKHLGGYKVDHDQQQRPVAEALRDFFASVMSAGAGLPIARRAARPSVPPPGVNPLVSR